MKKDSRLSLLVFIWMLMGIGVVGISCGGSGGCPAGQEPIDDIKFGSSAQPGCAFTCLGNGDCPDSEFCEGNVFEVNGICEACSASNNPGTFECDSDADCGTGGSCVGCQCEGGTGCAPVDVPAGSVPFDGACDSNVDCADSLPCVDCVCV